jgi:hypothetical protein
MQMLYFVILNISSLFSFGKYYYYSEQSFLEINILFNELAILLIITSISYYKKGKVLAIFWIHSSFSSVTNNYGSIFTR